MNEYEKEIRREGRIFCGLVIGVLVALLLLSFAARAENMVARDQKGNTMTLHNEPCADGKVLAFLALQGVATDQFRSGVMHYEGQDFEACWAAHPDGFIYVMDSAGDMSKVPMGMFRAETGV